MTRDDNLNVFDLAEVFAVSAVAALRGGSDEEDVRYTSRQKRHLDRIKRRADRREARLRDKN